jgi:hypothetical protein
MLCGPLQVQRCLEPVATAAAPGSFCMRLTRYQALLAYQTPGKILGHHTGYVDAVYGAPMTHTPFIWRLDHWHPEARSPRLPVSLTTPEPCDCISIAA